MNGMVGIPTSPITRQLPWTPLNKILLRMSPVTRQLPWTPLNKNKMSLRKYIASVAGDASNVDRNEAAIYHNDAGIVHIIKC